MASSSVTYTSGTNNFDITFGYLRDTHVIVQVGESQYDINDNYFTIDTTSTPKVVLNTPVSDGTTVKILRKSLGKNNDQGFLVDFVDGSVLTEKQQDEAYQHNYYINQESKEGNLSVDTPILDTDAANKAYVDGRLVAIGAGTVSSVTAGNGLSGGTITTSGTVSIPTSGGTLNIDSGNVGIAGDASSSYAAKVTGDLLISDDGTDGVNAHLTLENTHSTGMALIKASAAGDATLQLMDTTTSGTDDAIYNITSGSGSLIFSSVSDDQNSQTTLMQMFPTGNVKINQLPTTDPSTAGYLWNNGGVVSVSGSSGVVKLTNSGGTELNLIDTTANAVLNLDGPDNQQVKLESGSPTSATNLRLIADDQEAEIFLGDANRTANNLFNIVLREDNTTDFAVGDYNGGLPSTVYAVISIDHSDTANPKILMPNLPTSASGLATGTVYNDSGTLKIVT
tara:strand:- start:3664 stop:5019 length:1356 start_codon:yes stop_codon:yes gene_type:complete